MQFEADIVRSAFCAWGIAPVGGGTLERTKQDGVLTLKLTRKDLDDPRATVQVVQELVQVEGERKIVADLSEIQLLTSLQVGTLVALHLVCYESVAVMTLANVIERNRTVLKLVGLDKLMEIHHGKDVAVESLGPPCKSDPPITEGTPLPRLKDG